MKAVDQGGGGHVVFEYHQAVKYRALVAIAEGIPDRDVRTLVVARKTSRKLSEKYQEKYGIETVEKGLVR